MKINEKLKQIRKGKCLSQTEVAEQLGVTRQLVSSWEINIIPPKGHMKKLASILGFDFKQENKYYIDNEYFDV